MTLNRNDKIDKEVKDIIDIIISEFGYDKDRYTNGLDFYHFCDKLSIDTFKKFKNDGTIVLRISNVRFDLEGFYLELYFGYPKDKYIDDLSRSIDINNRLMSTVYYYNNIESTIYDLQLGYNILLRNKEIDKLLT